jgi:mannose-6-phosphate isomerase-like protein (cupin superfamily)
VTGGEMIDAKDTGAGEMRGSGIRGGTSLQLAAGDVLTIPQGVPHWFKTVNTPFRYFVVKSVTAP